MPQRFLSIGMGEVKFKSYFYLLAFTFVFCAKSLTDDMPE